MAVEIGREFMAKTKMEDPRRTGQGRGLPQPPLQRGVPTEAVVMELPSVEQIKVEALDLRTAIANRRTVRKYAPKDLSFEELAFLLWSCQGVQRVTDRPATLRTVPSAGARHAFETYALINGVAGLQPGLYRYLAIGHKLQVVDLSPGLAERIVAAAGGQSFLGHSGAVLIWTADIYRMTWRYGQRGYRYIHLDAGHACQNLYLAAQAVDCGVCAVAAFDDDELNRILGLDGQEQFVVYLAAVGKKRPGQG